MDNHIMLLLNAMASVLSGAMIIAALLLLWRKSNSEWLLLALVAESGSVLCRIALFVVPTVLNTKPILLLIWPVTGVLLAVGLLGYAVVESNRSR